MGREAICQCRWPGGAGEAKALLETRELILRGACKRRFALASMQNIEAAGDELSFSVAGEHFALVLGAEMSVKWATRINTPPPALRTKLGIGAAAPVLVIGPIDDQELIEAIGDDRAANADAQLSLAVVRNAADLDAALATHAALRPIWIVNIKGAASPFGENEIRQVMRGRGFIDSKTASVSACLAATRYARKPG